MVFKQIHNFLSFKRLFKFLAAFVVGIQLIIILYNHASGYYTLDGFGHFIGRLFGGSVLSLLSGLLMAYPDLFIIDYMNKIVPWGSNFVKRISIQLGFTVIISTIVAAAVTLLSHWIKPYEDHGIVQIIISNILIFNVVNVFIVAIFEGWILFIERGRVKKMAGELQAELSQIRFEVLKSQINPHFMFNSLNVLSGLISKDVSKAEQFIDEFSNIYRYVLESIEQTAVTLAKELDFARSYLFLQQIRYGKSLSYSINISSELLQMLMPPLSMQVVLENATKHNIVNESFPLDIKIYAEKDHLLIVNNIQPKISYGKSTGLGLNNLKKQYALICEEIPEFVVETKSYKVKLPLIKPE